MPAAQRDVTLVAADLDLLALALRAAVGADADHHRGLAPAVADRLELGQLVREREQARAALEQLAAEVGPEAVAEHGNREAIDDHGEIIHLLAGQELRFVQ